MVKWAPKWVNGHIFITDGAVVQAGLNSGRSRSPEIMNMIRKLFWLSVENNFTFISTYINMTVNTVCDALSKLDRSDSTERIKAVDVGKRMCCSHLFQNPVLCLSRFGFTQSRAAGL